MKIIPGIHPSGGECFFTGPAKKQCEFAIELLKKLQELKQNRLIHRDLHTGNILVNPETLEVNFIDFGYCVSVDEEGYWYGVDITGSNPKVRRYANGADIYQLWCIFPRFKDEKINHIFKSLFLRSAEKEDNMGFILEYNVVDLQLAIKEIQQYMKEATRCNPFTLFASLTLGLVTTSVAAYALAI